MPAYSAVSTKIKYGTLLASSTAQKLRSANTGPASGKGVVVQNLSHLSGQTPVNVYVGNSDVTAYNGVSIRSTDGKALGPGDVLRSGSTAEIWVVCNGSDTCMVDYFEDLA